MDNLKKVFVTKEDSNIQKIGILDKAHKVVYLSPVSIKSLLRSGYQIKEDSEELKDVSLHGSNSR